jgi:hypothetical protein
MRWLVSVALAAALTVHPAARESDQLAEARRLYNLGQYDAAEKLARAELAVPERADAARVVLGRVQLERYRQSADPADLAAARESLRSVDPLALDAREQVEYTVGLGEALYLEDRFGAAAQLFESVLTRSSVLGSSAHERVLDWWATALDRYAQTRPVEERAPAYDAIVARMRDEIVQYPGSAAAGYWLAAAARGRGDLERAWQAALAGWVRAGLAEDRGAELRADLDRLVVQAILPERAAKLGKPADAKQAFAVMLTEWEAFKTAWSK